MKANSHAINWFEIPVKDIDRAKKFYEGIFGVPMVPLPENMGMKMVAFPMGLEENSPHVGGALVESEMHQPSMEGSVLYLNANPEIQLVIDRIPVFGGEVTMSKTLVNQEIGYIAFFTDTEGNSIGLHADK